MTNYAIGYANCHIDTNSTSPTYKQCVGAGWYVSNASSYPWTQIKAPGTVASYQDAYNYILTIGLPGDQIYNYQSSKYVYTFPPLASITVPATQSILVGGQITITPVCKDNTGRTFVCTTATWTSSNSGVVAVTNGVIIGVTAGAATIQCSIGGISAVTVVTVTGNSAIPPNGSNPPSESPNPSTPGSSTATTTCDKTSNYKLPILGCQKKTYVYIGIAGLTIGIYLLLKRE